MLPYMFNLSMTDFLSTPAKIRPETLEMKNTAREHAQLGPWLLASSRVLKDGKAKSALHAATVDFFVFAIHTFKASITFEIQLLV